MVWNISILTIKWRFWNIFISRWYDPRFSSQHSWNLHSKLSASHTPFYAIDHKAIHRGLSTILQYLQCVINGDTAFLHWANDTIGPGYMRKRLDECGVLVCAHWHIKAGTNWPRLCKRRFQMLLIVWHSTQLYPPHNEFVGGILVSLRSSVCPPVHPSRITCPLCSAYSSSWIHSYFYLIKQL